MTLKPSEIIVFRSQCYAEGDGKGIFSLYSLKSELRKIFSEKEFAEHFKLLTGAAEHSGLKIVAENVKNNLAEVKYIEHIAEAGELTVWYSKTILTKEDGSWRILKEKREKKQI